MRYFFLFLLIAFLMFGCGRDAAGVGNDAANPAIAPASAPATPGANRNNQDPVRAPEVGAQEIGRDQMAPADPIDAPVLTPEDGRAVTPFNRGGQNQPQTQTRTNPSPQPQTAQFELGPDGDYAMIEVDKIEATKVFSVSTSPCYGDCKQYSLTLYNNGLVLFNGKKNVARKGYYSAILSDYPQSKLMAHFRDATAEGLQTIYPIGEAVAPDVPSTVLRYPAVDGREQSISVYADAPEKLQQLFDFVEEMIAREDWKLAKG